VKYALLGYDLDGSLDRLPAEASRAFHRRQRAHALFGSSVKLLAHYRVRSEPIAGAASEASAKVRALYILESDDPDAVVRFAEQLPAAEHGATAEIWPLTELRH
jgi:hypothetical protein